MVLFDRLAVTSAISLKASPFRSVALLHSASPPPPTWFGHRRTNRQLVALAAVDLTCSPVFLLFGN
ncbi:hypothetical protein BCR44DRAFT_1437733 [Catenaria anguillulae PL171]|uniref:Uncharacterized protein n=1 Tax=Catenaria anguillulae PL171 TaxID=765915 RepID=A0A1Y2HH40_9FUNG|nr:hypothetical protein BCR44DRAFT_1437733 [Catenaria anguillulae PL171]